MPCTNTAFTKIIIFYCEHDVAQQNFSNKTFWKKKNPNLSTVNANAVVIASIIPAPKGTFPNCKVHPGISAFQ